MHCIALNPEVTLSNMPLGMYILPMYIPNYRKYLGKVVLNIYFYNFLQFCTTPGSLFSHIFV